MGKEEVLFIEFSLTEVFKKTLVIDLTFYFYIFGFIAASVRK